MKIIHSKNQQLLGKDFSPEYQGRLHRRRWLLVAGFVILLMDLFRPWNIYKLQSHPQPVKNYAGAIRQIQRIRSRELTNFNSLGKLRFFTHHHKVSKVIVFVHGYTNSPQQFARLGESFFNLGYNVLIAPLPYHGLADRMTKEHAKLTAEDLILYSDRMVDIAQGLGKEVVMVGLSVGGNVTAWAAQTRSDLDAAVIIAPVFGYKQISVAFTPVVTNICLLLPNFFKWWDPVLKVHSGVAHSYPRFASKALAQSLRLGYAVQSQAKRNPPMAPNILIITNADDPSVHPAPIRRLINNWRRHGAKIKTYEFEQNLKLGHDFIDPDQPDAKVDQVYPQLIRLIRQVGL